MQSKMEKVNKVALETVIDASDKTIGRVATVVAFALRGKDKASFTRHLVPNVKVKIINASKLFIRETKKKGKSYVRYTGYPGGLRSATLMEVITKKGIAEPLRLAVYGMLPPNKLRPILMKNLIITE